MSLDDTRAALRSDLKSVLVEAPAGCGKTHEAADLAINLAPTLPKGQRILLLAHTNAAVKEFNRRVTGLSGMVQVSTIDGFCLNLLKPYATAVGLPNPLQRHVGEGQGRQDFSVLAPKAVSLLARTPTIARLLATRYPVVILDEHQDARPDQHQLVDLISGDRDIRVRIFGDPMQAIYQWDDQPTVDWAELEREADNVCKLETPQRWQANPELGRWIMEARICLRSGQALPINAAPSCIRIRRIHGMPDVGFGKGSAQHLSRALNGFLDDCRDTAVVLTRRQIAVQGIYSAAKRRMSINEGADYQDAYDALEEAQSAVGKPRNLAGILLSLLIEHATGFDKQKQQAFGKALTAAAIEYGRGQKLRPFFESFEPLYHQPDLSTFCEIAGKIARDPPTWLHIRTPQTFRLLGNLTNALGEDPFEALDAAVNTRKLSTYTPIRTVSTVHKAKGMEFAHVLVCHFSASHFPNDGMGRRLAYVAISRATDSLDFIVPGKAPSPLLA